MHVCTMQLVITNRLKSEVKQFWSIAAIPYMRNTVSINYMQQEVFVQFFSLLFLFRVPQKFGMTLISRCSKEFQLLWNFWFYRLDLSIWFGLFSEYIQSCTSVKLDTSWPVFLLQFLHSFFFHSLKGLRTWLEEAVLSLGGGKNKNKNKLLLQSRFKIQMCLFYRI